MHTIIVLTQNIVCLRSGNLVLHKQVRAPLLKQLNADESSTTVSSFVMTDLVRLHPQHGVSYRFIVSLLVALT